jgi:hypothetical protein
MVIFLSIFCISVLIFAAGVVGYLISDSLRDRRQNYMMKINDGRF